MFEALAEIIMNKSEILRILGTESNAVENENCTSLCVNIYSENIDVEVTIPYDIHELFYEAKDKQGVNLVNNQFDFYGDMEVEDFKECLLDIVDVITSPIL